MQANLQGYDYVYEIDAESLTASLDNLLGDPISKLFSTLDLSVLLPSPAPANAVQQGTLQTASPRSAAATLTTANDANAVVFSVNFADVLLGLTPVPGVTPVLGSVASFAGVGGLQPTNVGSLGITLTLHVTVNPGSGFATITIAQALPPAITTPANLGLLSNTIASPLASFDLTGPVRNAIETAVRNALLELLPLGITVPFAVPNVCGIGVRSLEVKVLSTGAVPALGFFMTALSAGPSQAAPSTASSLTGTAGAAIAMSNALLQALICCAFQNSTQIAGLGPDKDVDGVCTWTDVDNVNLGDQTVTVNFLTLSIDTSAPQALIKMSLKVTEGVTGGDVWVRVDTSVGLKQNPDGTLAATETVQPTITSGHDTDLWGWILGAVGLIVGVLIGVVFFVVPGGVAVDIALGAVIGAILGAVAGLGTVYALTSLANGVINRITGAVGALGGPDGSIVPSALTQTFGSLGGVTDLDFDDLYLAGRAALPAPRIFSKGENVVLDLGDAIDLDSGAIQRSGYAVAGFAAAGDLSWVQAPPVFEDKLAINAGTTGIGSALQNGNLLPMGNARLLVMNASYWSLLESTLARVAFPSASVTIGGESIGLARGSAAYPKGSIVFAVRTADKRLAKCIAWRDAQWRLHLSYVTYDTPVPLAIAAHLVTTRGAVVGDSGPYETVSVSRSGKYVAVGFGLAFIGATYRWLWNGVEIRGTGPLAGATGSGAIYTVSGDSVSLVTGTGAGFSGILEVEAVGLGATFVATLEVDEPGTERVPVVIDNGNEERLAAPVSSAPAPLPIGEQLSAALARGMNVEPAKVAFADLAIGTM